MCHVSADLAVFFQRGMRGLHHGTVPWVKGIYPWPLLSACVPSPTLVTLVLPGTTDSISDDKLGYCCCVCRGRRFLPLARHS